ncbi:MAG: hypothetical protein A2845_05790 [Candidatus Lloydbacteria bacterium RIFCSPHIGHO2_01_FULL_49_22]|uniref:Uncharacterized protein n=1 Tax=Candidatus Lloydbacteria bacterium RIFCSPHIGHO2_01_FULL_49_22 TaxID=1798658 RepID=A0A1G2CVU2_9BACT|nr:MAG: hypothetical protein A2845_05790 [Candidatus Lloydbacteria bacterium RIFCSPHIGHO2_01_FULL_49_22]OGZ09805.1 MAG: hypothetical protein A3C14_00225 [Candidatus Lloydbacteria bacterium RIFCSPHIGHO2_02_FULL_50_18]
MINLLPPIAKKTIHKEYRLRLVIVVLCALFVLELSSVILFLPSYFIMNSMTKTLADELEQKKTLSPEVNEQIPSQLTTIKKELALLQSSDDILGIPPSRLIGELLQNKPRGIELSSVAYAEMGGIIAIQFSGTAITREELLALQKAFKTSMVESIKFGSSFITKKSPIDFTVTVTFKKTIK